MSQTQTNITPIVIPYAPRQLQGVIHKNLDEHRWSVIVLHRRAGKTVLLLNQLIKRAMQNGQLRPRYAYIAPFLKQAKTLAWDYLKYYCDPIPGRVFSESELKVELPNGAQIRLYGADNPDSLRGIYLDGCVLDEYAQIDPVLFSSIIRPALSDRKGWCVFSGTPNGKNHFYDVLQTAQQAGTEEGWYSLVAPASETGIVDPAELRDAKRTMTEEEFEREYECSFNSIIGKRIYPEFNRHWHILQEDLIPTKKTLIFRGWDNTGLSPACVLAYITNGGQLRVFKEFCFEDCGIMEAVEGVVMWTNQFLPAGCTFRDICDPAGRIRDTSKMSARDYMVIKSREMGQDIWPEDGIQTWKVRRESVAGRLNKIYNGQPAFKVSEYGCPVLAEGFEGGYAYREIANMPGLYAEEAIKNKYSHIHDALQYLCTRVFLQASQIRTSPDGTEILDDDEDMYYTQEESRGRSTIGGY